MFYSNGNLGCVKATAWLRGGAVELGDAAGLASAMAGLRHGGWRDGGGSRVFRGRRSNLQRPLELHQYYGVAIRGYEGIRDSASNPVPGERPRQERGGGLEGRGGEGRGGDGGGVLVCAWP